MSTIGYTHSVLGALFGPIFLYVFVEKDCNRKKIMVVQCFDVIMIACFPKKLDVQGSSLFSRKAEGVPPLPGHPIILLKSNKFNMAAVSVKMV